MITLLAKQNFLFGELCLTQICNGNGPELGADFRTHEEDVGDPEADRY
jgi:hypothetical protein